MFSKQEIYKENLRERKERATSLPLRAFFAGQQTNSTPLKTSIPQGSSMAKERSFMPRSEQALPAVEFHWSKFQHFVWLWM